MNRKTFQSGLLGANDTRQGVRSCWARSAFRGEGQAIIERWYNAVNIYGWDCGRRIIRWRTILFGLMFVVRLVVYTKLWGRKRTILLSLILLIIHDYDALRAVLLYHLLFIGCWSSHCWLSCSIDLCWPMGDEWPCRCLFCFAWGDGHVIWWRRERKAGLLISQGENCCSLIF